MDDSSSKVGYVYILKALKTDLIKIGGSDYPPSKRIKEINNTEPYKSLGPWTLADFRQVTDWRKTEYSLHYVFREKLNLDIENQNELFGISALEAQKALISINEKEIVRKPKIDRMFHDEEFRDYLVKLFSFAGLMNWLDIQGAWTFSLYPSTSGGRYYTLNIGPHEVAFSTLAKNKSNPIHMILIDKLILDYLDVVKWVYQHNGDLELDHYATALPRSCGISFEGSFDNAIEFLRKDGVRRALIAYWNEALIGLKERNEVSNYSRHHNWNAIAELKYRILEEE